MTGNSLHSSAQEHGRAHKRTERQMDGGLLMKTANEADAVLHQEPADVSGWT